MMHSGSPPGYKKDGLAIRFPEAVFAKPSYAMRHGPVR